MGDRRQNRFGSNPVVLREAGYLIC